MPENDRRSGGGESNGACTNIATNQWKKKEQREFVALVYTELETIYECAMELLG